MRLLLNFVVTFMLPLFTLSACQKEEPIFKEPVAKSNLEVIWTKIFHSDSLPDIFLDPIFFEDYIVLSNRHEPFSGKQRGIRVFHKLTGENHPAWNHEPGGLVDNNDDIDDIQIGGPNHDILFVTNKEDLYATDLKTGRRLWRNTYQPNRLSNAFSTLGDHALQTGNPFTGSLSDSWCTILQFDYSTGKRSNLLQLEMEDDYSFLIMPPNWTINGNRDTLLLFMSTGWNFFIGKGKVNAYCYNLSRKEMVWTKKNFTQDGDASVILPLILENEKVVFQSLRAIHCLDISTGEIIWQHEHLSDGFSRTPALLREGRLYLRSAMGIVMCYDAQTGQEIWNNPANLLPAPGGRMDMYDNKLYLTAWTGSLQISLVCLSATTGEVLWKETGPWGKISRGIIIDQKTGYLYCSNDYGMICIDLTKTTKL